MSSSETRLTKERPIAMRLSATPLLLGLLALAGCATDRTGQGVAEPVIASERFAIDVRPAPEELKLGAHPDGLSPPQSAALGDFVRRWMLAEGGDITVKAPEHGGDPASAYRTATAARDLMIAQGVSAHRVRIVGYEANGDDRAPIVVGYMRYQAKGPDCGRVWGNLSAVGDNREWDNFGCSVTANVAAQIANPADLLAARQSDPADAQRRETVVDKYRQGAPTSTPKDQQADGSFSGVGH